MNGDTERILIDRVNEIHTVLLGVPGTSEGGLVKDVKCIREQVNKARSIMDSHDIAIAEINTRCAERAEAGKASKAKKVALWAAVIATCGSTVSAAIYCFIELGSRA